MKANDDLGKIKELVEIIKDKVDSVSLVQRGQSASIRLIKDQLSVVNRKIDVLEDPDVGLAAIHKRLDDPDAGLKRINERLDVNSGAVVELESTIKVYGDMYRTNNSNIRKIEKRVEKLEDEAGIETPPELQLAA